MFRTQRGITRAGSIGIVTGLAAVAVIGLSPAAYADAAALRFQGHVDGTKSSVSLKGNWGPTETELMVLGTRPGAPEVLVYCIDLETGVRSDVDYREGTWAESWLKDSAKVAKINWVLNNSYPKVTDLAALGTSAGLKKGRKLSADEAVAATQAAIWHYSNGAEVSKYWDNEDGKALYSFLTGAANKGQPNEPGASLELSPTTKNGKDGDTPGVGPVTVKTTSTEPVAVKLDGPVPAGVSLVGKDGNPVATAANGTDLFVKVPKSQQPGEAKISASTKAGVNVGRVFLGKDRKHSQTLITAGSQPFSVSASAQVKWSHQPVPVPSSAAKEECVEGGVTITLKNTGDAQAEFTVNSTKVVVPANSSKTHFVKIVEDSDYSIKVTGPVGYSQTHTGKLDCVETPTVPPTTAPPTSVPPTVPPTTVPPTTAPPTVPPTTAPPTVPPTSAPPTSAAPTTAPPTTAVPTVPPTTAPPTVPPTTAPPTTAPPTTSAPSTSAPATPTPSTSVSSSSAPSPSAPEPTTSPTAPPKPIVQPGTDDKPIVVPWLPVAPVGDSKDLANTGSDDSNTTIIAGTAVALLLAGGGALYLNKRRGRTQA